MKFQLNFSSVSDALASSRHGGVSSHHGHHKTNTSKNDSNRRNHSKSNNGFLKSLSQSSHHDHDHDHDACSVHTEATVSTSASSSSLLTSSTSSSLHAVSTSSITHKQGKVQFNMTITRSYEDNYDYDEYVCHDMYYTQNDYRRFKEHTAELARDVMKSEQAIMYNHTHKKQQQSQEQQQQSSSSSTDNNSVSSSSTSSTSSSASKSSKYSYESVLVRTIDMCRCWAFNSSSHSSSSHQNDTLFMEIITPKERKYLTRNLIQYPARHGLERWAVRVLSRERATRRVEVLETVLAVQEAIFEGEICGETSSLPPDEFIRRNSERLSRPSRLFATIMGHAVAESIQQESCFFC